MYLFSLKHEIIVFSGLYKHYTTLKGSTILCLHETNILICNRQ